MKKTYTSLLATLAVVALCGADATYKGGVQATNNLPNPYQTTAPWGKPTDNKKWGALNGVAIDNDGARRCGWPTAAVQIPTCRQARRRSRTTVAPDRSWRR